MQQSILQRYEYDGESSSCRSGSPGLTGRPQERCPALQTRAWAANWPTGCRDFIPRGKRDQWQQPYSPILTSTKSIAFIDWSQVFVQWHLNTWSAPAPWQNNWPMKMSRAHVGPGRSQWQWRAVNFTAPRSRWLVPALWSLFMLLHFMVNLKGRIGWLRGAKVA